MSSAPATKDDLVVLRSEVEEQFAEVKEQFAEVKEQFAEMRDQLSEMERRRALDKVDLQMEIQRVVNSAFEETRSYFRAIDDKYAPVVPHVDNLERLLDEHRVDFSLHKKPRGAAPKASRGPMSRTRKR